MSESQIDPRPVRKLTVKNFSVVKDADLEFGKITVLIGPQSSGKSLLCKLCHFLGRELPDLAVEQVAKRYQYSEFLESLEAEFSKWFPTTGWGNRNWSISFSTNEYAVTVSAPPTGPFYSPKFSFSDQFKNIYETRLSQTAAELEKNGFVPPLDALRSLAAVEIRRLMGRGVWDAATYIPVERTYFVDTQKGYRALGSEADPIAARFATLFANALNLGVPRPRLTSFLKGNLVQSPEGLSMVFEDGRMLPLNFLSSGSKEILPIVSVLDFYEYQRRQAGGRLPTEVLYGDRLYVADDFTIEEPEASVFPTTQYELVQEIVALSNETEFLPQFTITTHSPYILSVFADLIKAGKVGVQSPAHQLAVERVIPPRYWVRRGDFGAYKLENGKLESIFDKETGQIDGDYLDDVSGKISDELGQLLEIQYGK